MALEGKSTNDLVRIAAAGGGFVLDAAVRSTDDLIRIASAGSTHGARLVFTGISTRSTDDLIRIGAAGKGCAQFLS